MGRADKKEVRNLIPNAQRPEEGIELILCTRQPGNLRISKYACALRYQKAVQMDERIPDDDFGIALKFGLDICRKCPRGKRYAERLLSVSDQGKGKAYQKRRITRAHSGRKRRSDKLELAYSENNNEI